MVESSATPVGIVMPSTMTVKAGTSFVLRGDLVEAGGHKVHSELRYVSSNTSVLKCGDTGVHQAISAGSATITASGKNKTSTCTVTVI